MTDRRRGESRELRKDQQVRRETFEELGNETVQEHLEARYRNPNRDQARGDRDRSSRRTDENMSRDEHLPGDDGLRPPGDHPD